MGVFYGVQLMLGWLRWEALLGGFYSTKMVLSLIGQNWYEIFTYFSLVEVFLPICSMSLLVCFVLVQKCLCRWT